VERHIGATAINTLGAGEILLSIIVFFCSENENGRMESGIQRKMY
jgi:hypothetical protein